jgi:hypothetical protein
MRAILNLAIVGGAAGNGLHIDEAGPWPILGRELGLSWRPGGAFIYKIAVKLEIIDATVPIDGTA